MQPSALVQERLCTFIRTKLLHLAGDSAMFPSPIANHIDPPWGAAVVGPSGSEVKEPGVYAEIPWIPCGRSGITWPVIIACRSREDAEEINKILNPFISLWHQESISDFLNRLSQYDSWKDVCAMFDQPGASVWSVIHGRRCALYYDERHVIKTLNQNSLGYRTAYKFSSFHDAFVCHLTRADIVTNGTLVYRSTTAPSPRPSRGPLVAAPSGTPQSPPSTPSKSKSNQEETNEDYLSKMLSALALSRTYSLTPVSPTSTPSKSPVGIPRAFPKAGQSSTSGRNDPKDSDMIRIPNLVLQYITLHNLPEDWVRHSLNVSEGRRANFVKHMQERGLDREANFLWSLYETCIQLQDLLL
ncbi:uncharacterized protein EV420DRAFT_353337 [Desarmillaria tabescens]|uniref:Uncharacterized protein n=1 Tax=Armillaria tabescens TaxID=1929756 RepID=A0AA39J530_ARMTA|nr:uncharacterized protein EV420DRAFT_353337 [Desarmillaria tabescens]KAK0434979.1 hypothetical protein EV420DRAFT_353337 [Desarmillaria tabescens]